MRMPDPVVSQETPRAQSTRRSWPRRNANANQVGVQAMLPHCRRLPARPPMSRSGSA
jgi:hypothetical protein